MKKNVLLCLTALALLFAAKMPPPKGSPPAVVSDTQATPQTKALFTNLKGITEKGILFGHQDDLAYGVGWKEQAGRSDVKDVSGSYPAVYGWDVGKIGGEYNLDSVNFTKMESWIKEAYLRGGINTISWHMDNWVSGGSSWDTTQAVAAILPGGKQHAIYKQQLDIFATFVNRLEVNNTKIPIIFRPFHEHTGSWFWWGKRHCTTVEYKKLWHFTVDYLRKEKNLHHLLYAYSTDVFSSKNEYLERYPGDGYVDILTFDDYQSIKTPQGREALIKRLQTITELAESKGKLAAFSETGLESIPNRAWWTQVLLTSLKGYSNQNKLSYVLVWRNADTKHHYAPYPGHSSASDFVAFKEDPFTLFEDDLPHLYQQP